MPSRRRRYRSRPKPQIKRPPANQDLLRFPEVRLVGPDGQQLGVVSSADALQRAQENGTDIVVVAEKVVPPVVRIMDLGKHMYEVQKKQAKQKAKSKGGDVKGIRLGFRIGTHDMEIRLRKAEEFLRIGHKVRVEMKLHGREKGRPDMAEQKIREFVAQIPGGAQIEGGVSKAPNGITAIVTRTRSQAPAAA